MGPTWTFTFRSGGRAAPLPVWLAADVPSPSKAATIARRLLVSMANTTSMATMPPMTINTEVAKTIIALAPTATASFCGMQKIAYHKSGH
jgi:hypothetical protein